jgi:hypothetical protein
LAGLKIMMGHWQVEQAALFYEFSLEKHIPANHLLRSIDMFVDLEQVRSRCCPKQASRKVPRSIYEGARDMARQIARSWEATLRVGSAKDRDAVCAPQAHSQARPFTVTRPKWRS